MQFNPSAHLTGCVQGADGVGCVLVRDAGNSSHVEFQVCVYSKHIVLWFGWVA